MALRGLVYRIIISHTAEDKKMKLTDYEILYDLPAGEYQGRLIDGIRTVTIRAGKSLEVMCHPIMRRLPEGAKREAKARKTSPAMEKLNQRNLELKVMRLAEENFTPAAVVFTGTFEYPSMDDIGMMNLDDVWEKWIEDKLPEDETDVRRVVRNFLGRLRRKMENPKALKWMLRIEEKTKYEALGLPPCFHVHMLIEAEGLSQDDISAQWPFGFTRCDRFDMAHDGANRIAQYLTKNKRGGRWFSHSRNLKLPAPRVSDRKISRRRAMSIAADVRMEGRAILEKLYPGYRIMELPRVSYSDFMPGAFIYARMRRRD